MRNFSQFCHCFENNFPDFLNIGKVEIGKVMVEPLQNVMKREETRVKAKERKKREEWWRSNSDSSEDERVDRDTDEYPNKTVLKRREQMDGDVRRLEKDFKLMVMSEERQLQVWRKKVREDRWVVAISQQCYRWLKRKYPKDVGDMAPKIKATCLTKDFHLMTR